MESAVRGPLIVSHKSDFGHAQEMQRPRTQPNAKRSSPQRAFVKSAISNANRPSTVIGVSRADCERVRQVQQEPTRCHKFENHLGIRKAKRNVWRNLEPSMTPSVVCPGYLFARNKSKIEVTINPEQFFERDNIQNNSYSPEMKSDRERDSLIADLQQQVNDLSLALEEERLNHKQTKDKSAEILRSNLEKFVEDKSDDMKEISYIHQKEQDQMKEEYEIKLRDLRRTMEEMKNKLTAEIEFLNGAFESYKSQLSNDMHYKTEKKENELRNRLDKEKEDKIDELKTKLQNEKAVEKADLIQKHKKETLQIRREHKRELEALTRKYSNSAEDKQLLKSTEQDLGQLKDELLTSKENHNSVCKQLVEITDELAKTKFELLGYEKNFAEKVGAVDDQYRGKVEQLIEENVELRRRYADKCAKLSEERMSVEQLEKEKMKYAKENMRLKIEHQKQLELALSSKKQEKSKVEEEDDSSYSGFAKYAVFP